MRQQRERESRGNETAPTRASGGAGGTPHRRGSEVEGEPSADSAAGEPDRVVPQHTESEQEPKPVDETDVLSMGGPDSLQNVEQPEDGE